MEPLIDKRILVVEDSAVEAELLRRILIRAGYLATLAKDGEEGLRALHEQPFDLVLTDIRMPVMNGYEFCRAIKADQSLQHLPVIMLSALAEPEDIIEAINAGAESYLTKPYAEGSLLRRIRSLLSVSLRHVSEGGVQHVVEVEYNGRTHSVRASQRQMLNLLLSVYENIIEQNKELIRIQSQLSLLNESLEQQVCERTIALRESEARFRQLASTDGLTKLANRRILNDRLELVMSASKRSRRYAALMFVDLDGFKKINDLYGHDAGDRVLIEAAQRLSKCVREVDTVARIGGDEFVVMLNELDTDEHASSVQAGIVAEKIRAALALPYPLPSAQSFGSVTGSYCTSSIGVVLFIDHETSVNQLLMWSDRAMYLAKNSGGNNIRFLKPGDEFSGEADMNERLRRKANE